MNRKIRTTVVAVLATILAVVGIAPSAHANVVDDDGKIVTIVLLQTEKQILSVDIPSRYANEYREKLGDSAFKSREIVKATIAGAGVMPAGNDPLKPTVSYFRKKEVLQILNNIEKTNRWMDYINSWPVGKM